MKFLILQPHTFSHTISSPSLFLSLSLPQALKLYLSHIYFFIPATKPIRGRCWRWRHRHGEAMATAREKQHVVAATPLSHSHAPSLFSLLQADVRSSSGLGVMTVGRRWLSGRRSCARMEEKEGGAAVMFGLGFKFKPEPNPF